MPPQHDAQATGRWYADAFDEDYIARYAHRDAEEARRAVALMLDRVAPPAGAPVFDLCCGAGRHLAELCQRGINACGGDLSMPLLQHARPLAPCAGLVRLDMRRLPFPDEQFHVVTNFFTAFGYFDDDAENFGVYTEVRRILRPGGWFFFDFLNAGKVCHAIAHAPREQYIRLANGDEWHVERWLSPDGKRAEKLQRRIHAGSEDRLIRESVRLYTKPELWRALEDRGLEVKECLGDYDGGPFREEISDRLILVCRRG